MYFTEGRPLTKRERTKAILLTLFFTLSVGAGLLMFHFYPVGDYNFYPKCPSIALTGTHCPGCGTMRGISGLLHGNLSAIVTYNILAAVMLPFLLYNFMLLMWGALTGYRLPVLYFNAKELYLIAALITLYWIVRNFVPFLAPHG